MDYSGAISLGEKKVTSIPGQTSYTASPVAAVIRLARNLCNGFHLVFSIISCVYKPILMD